MKKMLFFLPLIIGIVFYVSIGIFSSFKLINYWAWINLGLLFFSGYLMYKGKWWGSILGILVGILLIYMGTRETGQIVKETIPGIIMCAYYLICAFVSYKGGKNE